MNKNMVGADDHLKVEVYQRDQHYDQLDFPLSQQQLFFVNAPLTYVDPEVAEDQYPVVYTLDGKVIAFGVLDFGADKHSYTRDSNSLLIRGVSVHPEYQGRGYGRRFMQAIPEFVDRELHSLGISELILGVNERNAAAIGLYLSCGYETLEGQVDGDHGPQYVMQYRL